MRIFILDAKVKKYYFCESRADYFYRFIHLFNQIYFKCEALTNFNFHINYISNAFMQKNKTDNNQLYFIILSKIRS